MSSSATRPVGSITQDYNRPYFIPNQFILSVECTMLFFQDFYM